MTTWDYTQFSSTFVKWAKRANAGSHIDECIGLAEAEFNRKIRHPLNTEIDTTFAIDEEYVDVPPYFVAFKDMHLNDSARTRVRHMTPGMMATRYAGRTGPPEACTTYGNKIRFAPVPSASTTATFAYYRSIPPLTSTDSTNWLLTNFPDLYLYASLIQLSNLLEDDARVGKWEAHCARLYAEIRKSADEHQFGLGPLQMDVDGAGDNEIGTNTV